MRTSIRTAWTTAGIVLAGASIAFAQGGPPQGGPGGPQNRGPNADPPVRQGLIERLDANRDNAVDFEEYFASTKQRFGELDADKDGAIAGDELDKTRPGRQRTLQIYDANNDGKVGLEELQAVVKRDFDRLDADRNGRLTERRPAQQAQRGQGQGQGPAQGQGQGQAQGQAPGQGQGPGQGAGPNAGNPPPPVPDINDGRRSRDRGNAGPGPQAGRGPGQGPNAGPGPNQGGQGAAPGNRDDRRFADRGRDDDRRGFDPRNDRRDADRFHGGPGWRFHGHGYGQDMRRMMWMWRHFGGPHFAPRGYDYRSMPPRGFDYRFAPNRGPGNGDPRFDDRRFDDRRFDPRNDPRNDPRFDDRPFDDRRYGPGQNQGPNQNDRRFDPRNDPRFNDRRYDPRYDGRPTDFQPGDGPGLDPHLMPNRA